MQVSGWEIRDDCFSEWITIPSRYRILGSFILDLDLSENFNERDENATVETQATGILTVKG